MSVRPLRPDEVQKLKVIPDYVIEAVNNIIVKKYAKSGFVFKLQDVVDYIVQHNSEITPEHLYANKHLDFEDVYRAQGWEVEFDNPGYNETYDAHFKFSHGGNHKTTVGT